ncbi:MAG: cell division protein FtsZ [Pseudomonadota bacterium]
MSIEFLPPEVDELTPRIAVIGVGGAGGNAIANMMRTGVQGVEFLVANTDSQALKQSSAPHRIQLGAKITQGLGAGSRPEIGRAAAEETLDHVTKSLEGAHMCFIAAGMGGGTGTGAAPVIAKAARDMGILTVGVVTKPFSFEGNRRAKAAEQGIEELQKYVDTLIVIPNQNLFLIASANTTFKEAFEMADEVLQQGVRGITDLMVMPGLINLDFADVRSVMQEMGKAMMGTGESSGDNRAIEAASKAIANPLLDGVSMKGAKGVIISITGGEDMRLMEVDEAANHIRELVDEDANIIWGSAFNSDLDGKIRVSVVATGIEATERAEAAPEAPSRAFSFSNPKRTEPEAPVAAAPEPQLDQPEPLAAPEASVADRWAGEPPVSDATPDPQVDDADTANATATDDSDELLLDSGAMVADAPETASADDEDTPAEPPVFGESAEDAAPSLGSIRSRWLSGGGKAEAEAAAGPKVKLGGTLFERMSNVTRGAAKGDDDDGGPDDKGPLDIPRFLHRQNNQ